MTAYTAHLDDDLLSAYLDDELSGRKAERVEHHLEDCPSCRARLDGLSRVVRALSRVEHAAPPQVLAQRVERRVALEDRRRGVVERIEDRLRGLTLDSPLVVSFTVVLALAVIVFLFSQRVAQHRSDVSLVVTSPEAARELLEAVEVVQVGDREMVRRGTWWHEVGTLEEPFDALRADGPRGEELRRAHPWLEELLAGGAHGVVFQDGGRAVAVVRDESFFPPVPGSSAAPAPVPER